MRRDVYYLAVKMAAATDKSLLQLNGATAVQMNDYSYLVYFYQYYSVKYKYTIQPTIWSE